MPRPRLTASPPNRNRPPGLGRAGAGLAALLLLAPAAFAQAPPSEDERVERILGGLSLAERIGQLDLVANSPSFSRDRIAAGAAGGVLAFTNGRDIADVQALARRAPSGIPLLVGLDVLHGLRTQYPLPLGEAASFDPDLAREVARAAAREAAAIGINWTFAPMADLARDPRWGRMVEGFGEDPHLGAAFTAARVRGFREGGLAVTLKHFAGYGAAIGGRDYDSASIGPGELVDAYLPPFAAGIGAGAESVMSAFHALDRVPATASRFLLTDTLRGRLGFSGFVVSDWLAIDQLRDHGVAATGAEAARLALAAGVDMDMASGLYAKHLPDEIAAGRVPEAAVAEAARRIVRTKLRMGLFEAPTSPPVLDAPPPPSPNDRALARRAAAESMVLLRNEGALPLAPGRRIALVGGIAADAKELVGPHAALVRYEDGVSILEGLRRRAESAGASLSFSPGCDVGCGSDAGFAAAVATAEAADVVVAVMGEPLELTGEAASRAYLTLPGRQAELLDRLVGAGKPVVLVLVASRPVELGRVVDRLAGLLMAWFPGTEGGNAVADLLFGDVSPSARLPVTWPRTIGQVPLFYDRLPTGRPPDPRNRFTLRYVDEEFTPLFPFGFGLGYGRVAYGPVRIDDPVVPRGGSAVVRATVSNVGPRPVSEVVQLYVRQPVARISRPLRQLKSFRKVVLAPGETASVALALPADALAYTDGTGARVLEPGRYEIFVGGASDAPLAGTIELQP